MSRRRARSRRSPHVGRAELVCPECKTKATIDAVDAVDAAPACPQCSEPMLTISLTATMPIKRRPREP